ncbi:MAG: class I SAM-dependent methyltransferase [Planctomycetota bacterium]|jgi:SAM-dependent methyltransferase
MKTRIGPDNPNGYNRYGFAWEHVPRGSAAHLDFGCYDGTFLYSLRNKRCARLVGVDISRDAVRKANERFPELEVHHVSGKMPLPFADGLFGSITLLDVLEHVYEQRALLNELDRVLSRDGIFIVTVPGRHAFSFMDMGNLKFIFPKFHRWYYCRTHSVAEYDQRYACNPDGLVGDISAEKRWHEHFSRRKLGNLLDECGFGVLSFDGAGFFGRVIKGFGLFFGRFPVLRSSIERIGKCDAKLFSSANLFCVASKRRDGESEE